MLAIVTPVLLAVAFLLLLLVSLSVPIIKTIYIFKLAVTVSSSLFNSGATGSAQFGVWGYCLSAIDVSVVGFDHDTNAQCSSPHLGYDFDSTVVNALHVNGIQNDISRTLTAALVLHPIACGLTFLALVSTAVLYCKGGVSRIATICTIVSTALATLLTTIIFAISISGVFAVRDKVNKHTDGDVHLTPGNAIWLTLGAAISLFLVLAGFCVELWTCRRRRSRCAIHHLDPSLRGYQYPFHLTLLCIPGFLTLSDVLHNAILTSFCLILAEPPISTENRAICINALRTRPPRPTTDMFMPDVKQDRSR